MKEEVARTKQCPYARNSMMFNYGMSMLPMIGMDAKAIEAAAKKYLDEATSETDKCIASDCMMWISDGLDHDDNGADYEIGHCGLVKP